MQPRTIADGLLTSLGELTFPIIREQVERIVPVSEAGIVAAMRFLWERASPGGALLGGAAGGAVERRTGLTGLRVGVILSGGNVDLDRLPWQS